jgi:hypothetical protein
MQVGLCDAKHLWQLQPGPGPEPSAMAASPHQAWLRVRWGCLAPVMRVREQQVLHVGGLLAVEISALNDYICAGR